ncbi:MAG TPA: bacillithiol biosynthesis deacetylase BshB1 [Fulvivirga sp.]|nr:bacillithiol biosynthesis deacetylase BshB1 [Fulvivirga sp.]
MKLDILAFAAHPDDTELGCAGTLALHISKGYKVGVIDLTRGELGTRGSAEIRDKEAEASAKLLGLAVRDNLKFADGFFSNDKSHQLAIIRAIRKYQPKMVLANAPSDRHPDHGKAAELVRDACFLSGLAKINVSDGDDALPAWRPEVVYHYIQSNYLTPDFIVDVSDHWSTKEQAIKCFSSQFYDPKSKEPATFISSPDFLEFIVSRAKELGHSIGAKYGEGFIKTKNIGVSNLFDLK